MNCPKRKKLIELLQQKRREHEMLMRDYNQIVSKINELEKRKKELEIRIFHVRGAIEVLEELERGGKHEENQ